MVTTAHLGHLQHGNPLVRLGKVLPSFFWVSFVGFFGQFRGGAKEYTKTNDSWFVQRGQAFAAAPLSGSAMKLRRP